ncbi:DUF222 domain-containing protein [Nocardioides sp. IC4_145]|uniref:HNH endonuclease n=1 Tax=Nocardioides sp. IC4_145 TaxID=2714037 RepID=UPI00140DFD1B|nr:HNH endonuclease signature motif containing protein [Nocardioides sp. IC4_145]NHC23957.1 DUF222 domain-containing protein [Nocardioides sp. IC4_145]
MFDVIQEPVTGVLHASDITAYREQLTAALETASGLDDVELIDAITALEDLVRVATAAQAAAGVPAEVRGRGVAAQVGLARKESHHRGQRHLALAKVVPDEMPHLWAAWRQGKVTEHGATHAARETACLEVEDRLEVDRLLAADPETLDAMSVRDIASFCRNHAARLDPAAVVKRRRKAEEERCVTIRPAPDTMVHLTALLPVKDGVACYAALTKTAGTARAEGDARTKGQVMADTLVDHVLAGHHATTGNKIELGLVMTDRSVLGDADDTAHIDGYGPIPAELGREILTDTLAAGEQLWLRRLYTSPTTGELVAMDSRARTYPAGLAKLIRLRDQVCRTPWCDAPIRHTDHADAVADGGETSAENGQGLCEACNLAKEAPGWHARPSPDGSIETTTPTGHRHRTRPPALATIHEVDAPPLHLDYYVLAT